MKNFRKTKVLGAHLKLCRYAPLVRTLFFLGAYLWNAPKLPQVRTLHLYNALQALYFSWAAMSVSP